MSSAVSDRDGDARLQAAAEAILQESLFQRSPRLSGLLRYLVEMTVSGQADSLKSITIAIEGLNRSPTSASDAYARVQVTRLRQALETCQAGKTGGDILRLAPGTYKLVLENHDAAQGAAPAARRMGRFRSALALALLALALVTVSMTWWVLHHSHSGESDAGWQTPDFPLVSVDVSTDPKGGPREVSEMLERRVLAELADYDGLGLVQGGAGGVDLSLQLEIEPGAGLNLGVKLMDLRSRTIIWTEYYRRPDATAESMSRLAAELAFQVGNTTGAVHAYNRMRIHHSDTPYSCWLRFTALIEISSTITDDQVFDCAREWHRHSKEDPLAAMARGWTLTDRALRQVFDARYEALLKDSVTVLTDASTLNPSSAGLQLALMRAHAFAGSDEEMKKAGERALNLSPDSPNVRALFALMLILRDDPQGLPLLDEAMTVHGDPPTWYHVGLAIDAMMRDDMNAWKSELEKLRILGERHPLVALLFAAHAGRAGRTAQARHLLESPPFGPAFAETKVEKLLERLPAAPAVRKKLSDALKPALDS